MNTNDTVPLCCIKRKRKYSGYRYYCRITTLSYIFQIKDNYSKVQLKNNLYLRVSNYGYKRKPQPLEHVFYHKTQQLKQSRPKVTLNTNRTQTITYHTQNANYAELIYTINFSPPVMPDFISKSTAICNYCHEEQTKNKDAISQETQPKNPILRQLLFWKKIIPLFLR